MSTKIVEIDRLLAGYGPEIGEIRAEFRRQAEVGVERIWANRKLSLRWRIQVWVLKNPTSQKIRTIWGIENVQTIRESRS
jgi:hypothetical protein